jgi:hypothetical protein
MSKKLEWRIETIVDMRPKMNDVWQTLMRGIESGPAIVTLSRPTRNDRQNRLMWSLLAEVSKQVEWYGQKLSPEDWKNVISAGLSQQKAVPGIDGGVVMVGLSTSKLDKATFSMLIDLIKMFGDREGVKWPVFVTDEYDHFLGAQK